MSANAAQRRAFADGVAKHIGEQNMCASPREDRIGRTCEPSRVEGYVRPPAQAPQAHWTIVLKSKVCLTRWRSQEQTGGTINDLYE